MTWRTISVFPKHRNNGKLGLIPTTDTLLRPASDYEHGGDGQVCGYTCPAVSFLAAADADTDAATEAPAATVEAHTRSANVFIVGDSTAGWCKLKLPKCLKPVLKPHGIVA